MQRCGSAQGRTRRSIGTRVPGAFEVDDDTTVGHQSCSALVVEHLDVPPDCAGGILAFEINGSACSRHAWRNDERALSPPAALHAQASPKVVQRGEAQDKSSEHKERRGEQQGLTP